MDIQEKEKKTLLCCSGMKFKPPIKYTHSVYIAVKDTTQILESQMS